jgi:hypothetical protein
MRPPPSRPIESPRRYPGTRAIVRNDGRPASAAPRRSGSQAITHVGLHASHKQPPARRPRFKSVDIVGFEFVARHNLVVQQAPIRGLERRSWIIRKGNQLVGMAADLRVVGFGSPSAAELQFCSAANAGAAPAAPETPACVPFRSFGGPVPRVPPRCELQKSQARRRPRGRVLPARVPSRETGAELTVRSALLPALSETGRSGSWRPAPPRMQGWPIGAFVGHALLLHALSGSLVKTAPTATMQQWRG